MKTTGPRKDQLRKALLDAFRRASDLEIAVADADLGVTFANYLAVPATKYETAVFQLLEDIEAQNKLIPFLKAARKAVPGNPELRAAAADFAVLEEKYDSLRPVVPLSEAERIVFAGLDFENVGVWLDDMGKKRRAICRIEPQPQAQSIAGYGTGFLVAPDVVMTNDHVAVNFYDDAEKAKNVVCRFDYETGLDDKTINPGKEYKLHATDWRILRSAEPELDFALLKLNGRAVDDVVGGAPRGFLTPSAYTFTEEEPLAIIQHPMAAPLKLALGPVDKKPWDTNRVTHKVNTQGGSSGSPCFTQKRLVAALHHYALDVNNQGVLMSAILTHLKGLPEADRKRLTDNGLGHLLA